MCRRLRPLLCSRATARARSAGTHSLLAVVAFVFADLLPLIETGIPSTERAVRACMRLTALLPVDRLVQHKQTKHYRCELLSPSCGGVS